MNTVLFGIGMLAIVYLAVGGGVWGTVGPENAPFWYVVLTWPRFIKD